MGEFDISLIREFRSRPAFYDRNSTRFKDKVYTAHEWQEISNKLGYDVSLLKDRMLQLRNRYNLEKRRLEQIREEQPDKKVESPWPLYEQLQFLSEHIRARRSYKRMLPISPQANNAGNATTAAAGVTADFSNSGSNFSSVGGDGGCGGTDALQSAARLANGLVTVKMEEIESDIESENLSEPDNNGDAFNPGDHPSMIAQARLRDHSFNSSANGYQQQYPAQSNRRGGNTGWGGGGGSLPSTVSHNRSDTIRGNAVITTIPMPMQTSLPTTTTTTKPIKRPSCSTIASNNAAQQHESDAAAAHAAKLRCLDARDQKYAAFGNFVSSSLLELPACKALMLVEKFTSEVVKLLIQSETAAATVNGNDNGGAKAGGGGGVNNNISIIENQTDLNT